MVLQTPPWHIHPHQSSTMSTQRSNISILACVLLIPVSLGGYVYSFGLYANELKESLNLSQSELTTLSSSIFAAGALQFFPGLIVDTYGERFSLLVGGQVGGGSMLVYWMVATKYLAVEREWLVTILTMLTISTFLSNSLICGAVFKVIVKLCDGEKGTIVGVAKGHIGLGAGAFAAIFSSLRRESSLDLLLIVAVTFWIFGTLIPYFMVPITVEASVSQLTKKHVYCLYLGMVTLAVLVLSQSLLNLGQDTSGSIVIVKQGPDYIQLFLVLSAWIGPIVGLVFMDKAEHPTKDEHESLLTRNVEKAEHQSFTLVEMVQTLPAWLLWWTLTALAGAGLIVTQNVGQMVQALEMSPAVTSTALAIFSVSNAAARVASGALSEFISRRGIPRPVLLLQAALSATLAHACLAMSVNSVSQFLASIALAGAAYGMYHPLLILIVGDIFGPTNLASNFLFMDGATLAVGSMLLNKGISQYNYEKHLTEESPTICIGRGCFGATHWITAALCLTSLLTCLCLLCTKLTRQAYSNGFAHEK